MKKYTVRNMLPELYSLFKGVSCLPVGDLIAALATEKALEITVPAVTILLCIVLIVVAMRTSAAACVLS